MALSSKEKILTLLGKGEIDDVFSELGKSFHNNNDKLNALIDEFINPPGTWDKATFMSRLRLFINTKYNPQPELPEMETIDYYQALCKLNFTLQTHHFRRIYKHKKLAAFLLHGDTDEQGSDVRWLYNQLLYNEGLSIERPVMVDLSSKLGGSSGRLLEELLISFDISTDTGTPEDHYVDLKIALEERLKTGHFVCIVKSPECMLGNETELCKLFEDFFSFINRIRQKGHNHSLVFLFIEHKLVDYHSKKKKYFIWFDDQDGANYSINAVACTDVKIIDLAPIGKIGETDIINWIDWSLENRQLYERIRSIKGREKEILLGGTQPYQVIKQICTELNIEIEKRWIE